MELVIGNLVLFCRSHQLGGDAVFQVVGDDPFKGADEHLSVTSLRKRGHDISGRSLGQRDPFEIGGERLTLRHQGVEIAALAGKHIPQHLAGSVVITFETGEAIGNYRETIGKVRV